MMLTDRPADPAVFKPIDPLPYFGRCCAFAAVVEIPAIVLMQAGWGWPWWVATTAGVAYAFVVRRLARRT